MPERDIAGMVLSVELLSMSRLCQLFLELVCNLGSNMGGGRWKVDFQLAWKVWLFECHAPAVFLYGGCVIITLDGGRTGEVMRIKVLIFCVLLLGCPGFLCSDDCTVLLPDDARTSYYNIGLIAEMGGWEGEVAFSFISMAIRDFYNLNSGLRTGIVLHVRDSKGDSLQSIDAALDLLENVQVHAIIVPKISNEELFLARLGDKVNVPLLSFSSLSSSSQHPYFVQVAEDEINQFHGIATLIKTFKWRSFVFLYEDTLDARLSQTYIHDIFQENHLDIAYRTAISPQATDVQIVNELHKLMMTNASIFVVHLSPSLASQVFMNAKMLGMMSNGFAWIVTSKTMNLLDPQDSSLCDSMQGVLGFKSYIPVSSKLQNLTLRWKGEFQHLESNLKIKQPDIVGLWAYDAAWVLAEAIENVTGQPSQDQIGASESGHLDLDGIKVSNSGSSILRKITSSKFTGVAGDFELTNRKLVQGAYEIQNIICKVERGVGFWKPVSGLTTDINSQDNLSSNNLDTIVWPGFSFAAPQSQLTWQSGKRFRIGVPGHGRFCELVCPHRNPENNSVTFTGFCMDVFHAALDKLPYKISPEFVSFDNEKGSYNELVQNVYLQTFDAAVGDITILANRSAFVDFTVPYSELGVGFMVKLNNDPWFFLKPLSPLLWIVSACSFVLTGFTVWVLEHRTNEEFQGSPAEQIGAVLWFAVSTLVYAHRERLRSNASRFVVGVWFFVVLILTSSYIANLSSLLTVAQFKFAKGHYIGYSANSFIRGMIVQDNVNFEDSKLKSYHSPEQYYDALTKGSKNGGVDAIIEEVPYIKTLVARNPCDYAMVKSSPKTSGFGFAFPKGSPLVHEMSRAIAELREEGKLVELEKRWFKSQSMLSVQESDMTKLSPLNMKQFAGLFIINGISQFIAILVFIVFLLRGKLWGSFYFLTMLRGGKLIRILGYFYPRTVNGIDRL